MNELRIFFDVDGTIYGSPLACKSEPSANIKIVQLMELLHDNIKNVKIFVWSGGGKEYAESIVNKFGLNKWVDGCFAKQDYNEEIWGKVDIAFDDQHEFSMADKNLIVRITK